MATFDAEEFVAGQKASWNRVAAGWEKWDAIFDTWYQDFNEEIVAKAGVTPGDQTLDLGSGTGYPAVTAAQKVGPAGSVHGSDISAEMLAAARRKAAKNGLANITFAISDARKIPFDDNHFDAVTSRFCLMFLPDPGQSFAEIHRTLKPGKRFAAATWAAPEKNLAFTMPFRTLMKKLALEPPPPDTPGVFALSDHGRVMQLMADAGFIDTFVEERELFFSYPSMEEFLSSLTDLAAPMRDLLDKMDEKTRKEALEEIAAGAEGYRDGEKIVYAVTPLLFGGRKGAA